MAWLEREAFELVICPALLDEVREVMTQRPRLRRWIDVDTAEAYLAAIELAADVVADPVDVEARTRDVDDDYLVALALERHTCGVARGLRAEFAAHRRRGAVTLDDGTRQVVAEIIRTRSLDQAFGRLAAEDPEHVV